MPQPELRMLLNFRERSSRSSGQPLTANTRRAKETHCSHRTKTLYEQTSPQVAAASRRGNEQR
jgi:hypothetical protein